MLSDLILAFSRKDFETARFMRGLTEDQRLIWLKASNSYFDLARSFYSEEGQAALDSARTAEMKYGEDFGWPNGISDVLTMGRFSGTSKAFR